MAKFAMMFLSMMLITVGCGSTSDSSNNSNPANTDGSLCLGKADCPTLDASNGADNDSSGATDDTISVDNDNGGNTDVVVTDPCAGFEELTSQEWECHYGMVVVCTPECLVYDGVTYIACGGGSSLVNEAVFVPSISNPTEVQMTFGGGATCYNVTNN